MMPAIDLANPLLVKILLQDDKHLLAFQLFLDKHLVAYIANYKGVTYLTPVVPEILEGRHIAGSPVLDFTQEELDKLGERPIAATLEDLERIYGD